MPARALLSLLLIGVVVSHAHAADPSRWTIPYAGRAPEGLVGNGQSVVRVRSDSVAFHAGGDTRAKLRLVIGDTLVSLSPAGTSATFFPGGVEYHALVRGLRVDVLHGALRNVPWCAIVRVRGARGPVWLDVVPTGHPDLGPAGRVPFRLKDGAGQIALAAGALPPEDTYDGLRAKIEAPYRTGLVLETPDAALDRAVPFCRALLDLGFDGRMHVCEIFRWRDVWSRDLGSGLVPGAMASGRFDDAAVTLHYDLARHAKADPKGLKVTEDPSQGGTAEGVAWLTRAVWRQYLLTGDRTFLAGAEQTLKPWVEAWIDRDPDERGLLTDVSEWMDHSRFFLFPDGARGLYSNVLFVGLLRRFASIEGELGDEQAQMRYSAIAERFVRGVNAGLWDETSGEYDNLSMWGQRDERSTAAENALAVLNGVATGNRGERALAAVKARNWRKAGSTTIYPPMTHVPAYIDHNFKMWPWWNAVEARARFMLGQREDGVWLLDRCAATLEDEHYPGQIEELTTPEGVTEGGNAFLTAAGSYLDGVVGGLLGVDIMAPGCARLRVDPQAPAAWKRWRAEVPLPQGALFLSMRDGVLHVKVTDPRVRQIEAPEHAIVEGAAHIPLERRHVPEPADTTAPGLPALPAPAPRHAAVFAASGLPAPAVAAPAGPRIGAAELAALDPRRVGAVIVPGNALPLHAADGTDVQAALAGYLDRGGALVFWGATMHERGTMGEQGGVIEWYEQRPVVQFADVKDWTFRPSMDAQTVPREKERGMREQWSAPSLAAGPEWKPIEVPAGWEKAMGYDYDGWGWYRAHFALPASARGRVIVFDLGRIDDRDWTFVNGVEIGASSDWQRIRHYRIRPGDPAYATLTFGGDNVIAVEVLDTGGGGGLYADVPRVGPETDAVAWSPIDPKSGEVAPGPVRHAVVSWGPGGRFFNSWETSRGAFGFSIEGHGIDFAGPLAGIVPIDVPAAEAFTDFAVSRPWRFEPLAFTSTQRHILVPDLGERYPCAARLRNTTTGGEIVLIPASIARTAAGPDVLKHLNLELAP